MTFVSYAQNYEDVMLWRVFKDVEHGFYIDVGAQHPKTHSVTKAFYDRGWNGVNIEPVEAFFLELEAERPRDVNVKAAATDRVGHVSFFSIEDTGLSTTEDRIAIQHRESGHPVVAGEVEATTLAKICETYATGPIHFLKIDVEGGTRAVIEGMDLQRFRPWVILVEATEPLSQVDVSGEWEGLLVGSRYRFVYFDGLNKFYVAEEHKSLCSALATPPNVFDDFVLASTEEHLLAACSAASRARELAREAEARASETAREAEARASETAREAERSARQLALEAESRARAFARETELLADAFREQVGRTRAAEERAYRAELEAASLRDAVREQLARYEAAERRAHRAEAESASLAMAAEERAARQDAAAARAHRQDGPVGAEAETIVALRDRLHERELLLRAVFESRSWRLTAPVRLLGSALARPPRREHRPSGPTRPARPTVFIECTHTYHSDLNTGIQRVVRNVLRHAPAVARQYGYDVVPVILDDDRFRVADVTRVLADKQRVAAAPVPLLPEPEPAPAPEAGRMPGRATERRLRSPLQRAAAPALDLLRTVSRGVGLERHVEALLRLPEPPAPPPPPALSSLDDLERCDGSILLLLDSSWTNPLWPSARRFKERGGMIAGVIYDLIPITHRHTSVDELAVVFEAWLAEHIRWTDSFLCISNAIADSLTEYIRGQQPAGGAASRASVGYFHLGSDLDFLVSDDPIRPSIMDMFAADRHVFLMVGSIEPRKMHAHVLDAFDRFWAAGEKAALVIIGRQSWKTDELLARLAAHPELGSQLFVVRDATDAELDYSYRHASSLLIASEIEGFGLPIVEAFQRGLPVICSDIPVFREIADGRAIFFGLSDPSHLIDALRTFCRTVDLDSRKQRRPQGWIGWRESTEQLFSTLMRARHARPFMPEPAG